MLGRLKTKVWLYEMNILQADNLKRPFCKSVDESIEHFVFRMHVFVAGMGDVFEWDRN